MLHNYTSTVAPANTARRHCRKCHEVLAITERFKACEGCRAGERAYAQRRRDAQSASVRNELFRTSGPQVAPANYSSASASVWTAPGWSVGYSSPTNSSSTSAASHHASPPPVPHTAPAAMPPSRTLNAHAQATHYTFPAAPTGSASASLAAPPAYTAAPAARPSGSFLERLLTDIGLVAGWLATLRAIGMTEANLRVMADWEEQRRDVLIAKVVPAMSIMDRALLGEAISRL
ncbi:hypothetical protein B0H16DRAFT_43083 [Mycena metata]|uniref:Uncharacterized protein n=1 Tax=Mycena metata TaxID=1033252 RepID=A0AAD7K004_9AGAR|nr:hypothetical protein B0H16DRAFT_43083 [Mycena metata]